MPSNELSSKILDRYIQLNDQNIPFIVIFSSSHEIDLAETTKALADKNNFEVRGYSFSAQPEELRKPRIVRVAAVQNSIVKLTTDKIAIQRDALHAKIGEIVKAAAASNVNIICFQEAWSKLDQIR